MKPRAVSSTYVRSRTGRRSPRTIFSRPAASCAAIVGMTAREDCRGPYVLNGRIVATGVPNER
jgi:hypothetical protein